MPTTSPILPLADDALTCFVLWCQWNPRLAADVATVRRVFAAYAQN